MILLFILLLVIIPLTATHFLGNILLSKINIARKNKAITLILTYLLTLTLFICLTVYFSFGPLFYGHRQAHNFYNSNKNELRKLIADFVSLKNKGLLEITKLEENNLKILFLLPSKKEAVDFIITDKGGKYDIPKMTKNQPALIYNPNGPKSLEEILNNNQISGDQFESILEQFKKAGIYNLRSYGEEYLIGIRETFPLQIACLFFCKPSDKDCNSDKGNAQIDKGVYFSKLSNP